MLFVRGIMGDVKLNPAIKLWGTLVIVVGAFVLGLIIAFADIGNAVEECEASGGTWVGGAAPPRLGLRWRVIGYCFDKSDEGAAW